MIGVHDMNLMKPWKFLEVIIEPSNGILVTQNPWSLVMANAHEWMV